MRSRNWVQLRMEDITLSWQQPSPLRSSRSYYGATQLEERSRRQIDSRPQLQAKTAKDAGFVFLPKPHFRGHLCCARWMVMDHFNALPRDVSFDWICDTIFFCQSYLELFVIPLWAAKSKYYDRKTNNQVSLASMLNLQISFWHVHNGYG